MPRLTTRRTLAAGALAAAAALAACAGHSARAGASADVAAADAAAGWRPLLDPTLSRWRGYRAAVVPAGWSVVDGVLVKRGEAADLVTREQYGDFELAFDWMLDAGGNAGVFYRVTEEYDHPYWTGPEYQLLDDARHPDGRDPLTSAAAAYGLYAAPRGVVKAAGEWNAARIVVRGSHVEHWLNGQRVVAYDLGSPDWEAKVKASKFGRWPNYGRAARGFIALQGDHDGTLSLRGLRIRAPR